MHPAHLQTISTELGVRPEQVRAVADLLADGATVPFISRYRKEATGSLDEVAVLGVRDRLEQLAEMDKRREAMLKSLKERELLTDELAAALADAPNLAALEDAYLPFRPKRRTRATIAREKGLQPLADWLLEEAAKHPEQATREDPQVRAAGFVDAEKDVPDADAALAGARDIVAETVSEDPESRAEMRAFFVSAGTLRSTVRKGKETEGAKFRDYFDREEPVGKVAGHRVLAMRRGEREEILSLRTAPPEESAVRLLERRWIRNRSACAEEVRAAVKDGYRRLLSLSMETEIRLEMKRRADEEAIEVFAANLRELLLAPALGPRTLLALDPGFRTGCKLVILDRSGALIHNDTIYPHTGREREAAATVTALVKKHGVEAVAVGNGTAGRETETFVRGLGLPPEIMVVMVSESGASIYSASETARREFPDHDLTVRGAVSIGRRLTDPLAELVKIDPKSIGVGQYQHDVDQSALKRSLDDVVVHCVNAVGVDVNTASRELLGYVSGLGPVLADNVVRHRETEGAFARRKDLLKVARLGPKAYEQAAGFLRVNGGPEPLDASAVHPENYAVVQAMAADLGRDTASLVGDPEAAAAIDPRRYVTDDVGLPTLQDILAELARPGRDPREEFTVFRFAENIGTLEDLQEDMRLPGIVTNVTNFGAFVDVGVHQDGLVHVSQLADRFVRDPNEIVKVGQKVTVRVLEVDLERRRISLSMKGLD